MTEIPEVIVKIRDWCFAQEPKSYNDHKLFQFLLVNLLRENGWYAYEEYEIENYPYFKASTGEIKVQGAFLDVCAFAHNKKLVVEYDNCNNLKINSINKLFHSNADFPIGIVHGRYSKPFLRAENINKIKKIAKKLGVTNKAIFLIIIANKIAEWVLV